MCLSTTKITYLILESLLCLIAMYMDSSFSVSVSVLPMAAHKIPTDVVLILRSISGYKQFLNPEFCSLRTAGVL